ncbi:MAG TPA: exodeoxyribonuclease VII large subunit [Solirubrobacteraceae bacterium]|jgi:exodeoxyribonuclease VII large subunit|nr:exodeoxyribonuclease VII large subunit [Solirubrobacteraceae bacterium]
MAGPSSSSRAPNAVEPPAGAVRAARLDDPADVAPAGIPENRLAGPFPVGDYASALRGRLRSFANVQLVGELVNLRPSRARVYFELRDAGGALPCAVWREEWERMLARGGETPIDGMQVVVAGGCDYYPGSATSSPGFSFAVSDLRVAGEGDLLARIDRLRKRLDSEGLCELQKRLPLPLVPRAIGVITGERGKARDDVLAALTRRGWMGRVVWGFAPVQDRHAAPAIVRALGDLAGAARVDVVIVARGGGSLADLLCFCDETLCRTVALLGVPVIASVGHHTDRTLLDDVAAVSCSTPTHAAEAAVGLDLRRARHQLAGDAARLRDHGHRAVLGRARLLASLSRAPGAHVERQRTRLHQQLRELRAGTRRRVESERDRTARRALVLARKAGATLLDCRERRPRELAQLALALAAHEPQRALERGYALVESPDGEPLASASDARAARDVRLRFADGAVSARVDER